MNFQQSVKTCLTSKYSAFDGRAARSEYWWFTLFGFLIYLGATLIEVTTLSGLDRDIGLISGLTGLATLLPDLAVTARRLHDVEKSGWWQLLWLLPVLGWIPLIYWLVQEGSYGDNEYGVSPQAGPSISP